MRFVSTRGQAPPATLREALLAGPAPDGGLYVPEDLRPLPPDTIAHFHGISFQAVAYELTHYLLNRTISPGAMEDIMETAFPFEIPLVAIEEGVWALELFHGPTLAFKDVGARFMARLFAYYLDSQKHPVTILVATSGDTGSAVAQAFHNVPGIDVQVLFPSGQVSPRQRMMFTTLEGNVTALEVQGTFDDCQALVRQAFADLELRSRRPLASANSINVGRLLPQMFYYFHAVAQLPPGSPPPVICVPSGNFGNLTAGLMAKRLGLPVQRFVAATNVNDVVPEYLRTGEYRPRPSVHTLSNAMDVGDPSNFERITWLYGHDVEALRRDLHGCAFTDEQARGAMAEVYQRRRYMLEPHSATGYLGIRQGLGLHSGHPGVFLATAHPAKFPEVVREAIGEAPPMLHGLASATTGIEQTVAMPVQYDLFKSYLLN